MIFHYIYLLNLKLKVYVKTDEINFLKEELSKTKIQIEETKKQITKNEEDETVLKIREQERQTFIAEIELKSKPITRNRI